MPTCPSGRRTGSDGASGGCSTGGGGRRSSGSGGGFERAPAATAGAGAGPGRRGDGGQRRALGERAADLSLEEGEDFALVAEAHLELRRVDVDVDVGRGQADVDDGERMASGHEEAVVGLFDGEGQGAAAHPATVDEQRDVVAVSPGQARLPYQAADEGGSGRRARRRRGERQERLRDLVAVDAGRGVAEVGVAGRAQGEAAVG